jgi:hypothetical protein
VPRRPQGFEEPLTEPAGATGDEDVHPCILSVRTGDSLPGVISHAR